ncbi:MAG: response regulator, partial [Armatimonadetes bacterium]|nr:response regulator [Armatimonadota bacterium]
MRVLIAEDDRINRRLLEVSLRDWGYDVVSAADGAEAWALLQEDEAPPLVILDWMMPVLDGVEVC